MSAMPVRLRIDPFPYQEGTFPADLGAFVSLTVLRGEAPALYAQHNHDNSWAVTDAQGDPNDDGALVVACIWDVIERDPTFEAIAWLPVGAEAVRDAPGEPWDWRFFEEEGDGHNTA